MKEFIRSIFWIIVVSFLACHPESEQLDKNTAAPEAESNKLNILLSEEELAFYHFYLDSMITTYQSTYTLEELIDRLNDTIIEGMYIGDPGRLSDDYFSYEALQRMISKEEIQSLIASDSPIKKYYGFRLHAEKVQTGVLNLLIDHLDDTTRIRTHSGCILDESKLIDLMIGLVTENYYQPGYFVDYISQDSCYQLNEREVKWLKSIADRRNVQLELFPGNKPH